MPSAPVLRGIVTLIVAMAVFTVNDTLMKIVAANLPPLQVVAMRGVFATLVMVVVVIALGEARAIPRLADPMVNLRSGVEFLSIAAFITALARFPIGDVVAIAQTAPLILVPLAALLYRERIGPARAVLVLIGFAGAMMVTQPGAQGFDPLVLITFVCAFTQAVRDLLQRRIDAAIPSSIIALSTCGVVAVLASITAFALGAVMPTLQQLGMLAVAGSLLAAGHFLLIAAFRMAPLSTVAPFGYSATLWAVISGSLVFGDHPDALTLAGIAVLVVSGVVLARLSAPKAAP